MKSNLAQIGSGIIASLTWLVLLVDAFTPLRLLGSGDDPHSLVITLAGVSSIGFLITVYRRPALEVYQLGIAHGRRIQLRETMNSCKVIPIAPHRNQHEAILQAAIDRAVKIAVADALTAAEAMRANADN